MKNALRFVWGMLLVSLLTTSFDEVQGNTVSWGSRSLRDHHLGRQVIVKEALKWRVVTKEYLFKQKDQYPARITQVVVTDPRVEGRGGYSTLKRGGPGFTFVEIHFKSQRTKGIYLIVDIFGTKSPYAKS